MRRNILKPDMLTNDTVRNIGLFYLQAHGKLAVSRFSHFAVAQFDKPTINEITEDELKVNVIEGCFKHW